MTDGDFAADAEAAPAKGEPGLPPLSEEAMTLDFAELHAGELRYVAKWGVWYRWRGTHWRRDDTLKTVHLVRCFCGGIASKLEKPGVASAVASAKTVRNVERLARSEPRLSATIDQWDADCWALNTPGGVMDLRTGYMRPHRPEDYFTKMTAVAPAGGDCPLFLGFLDRITGGDRGRERFLQRSLGYALTGDTSAHAMFFWYGTGANGKSVLLETVAAILGDYHRKAQVETFTASPTDRHPTELAMLQGARLVTAVETEQGRRWAEALIKSLTGGDVIAARFMRQDFFEFVPQFKLLIAGNHKPGLRTVDEAMRRRFHLVPFAVTIPNNERDPDLRDKLKAEWPQILQWLVDGCLEYQRDGLSPPEAVIEATESYMEAEDTLSAWSDDCCEMDAQAWTSTSELYESWKAWAGRRGEYVGSAKRFSQTLEGRGWRYLRKRDGRGFSGVRLQPAGGLL